MNNTNTETIYRGISQLPNNEKIILLSKLMLEISVSVGGDSKTNIYDIKGVGKEVWEGIDTQEYVHKERASWEK